MLSNEGNILAKVKCSYGVPVSNPVARKSFIFRSQNNNKTVKLSPATGFEIGTP